MRQSTYLAKCLCESVCVCVKKQDSYTYTTLLELEEGENKKSYSASNYLQTAWISEPDYQVIK